MIWLSRLSEQSPCDLTHQAVSYFTPALESISIHHKAVYHLPHLMSPEITPRYGDLNRVPSERRFHAINLSPDCEDISKFWTW
jgi:hypothetical protein